MLESLKKQHERQEGEVSIHEDDFSVSKPATLYTIQRRYGDQPWLSTYGEYLNYSEVHEKLADLRRYFEYSVFRVLELEVCDCTALFIAADEDNPLNTSKLEDD